MLQVSPNISLMLTAEEGYEKVGSLERQYLHGPEKQRMEVPIRGKNG